MGQEEEQQQLQQRQGEEAPPPSSQATSQEPSTQTAPPPPPFDPSRMVGIIKRKALIKELAAAYHAECLEYCQEILELQRKSDEYGLTPSSSDLYIRSNKAKAGSVFPSPPCPANGVEMGGREMLLLLPEYSDETGPFIDLKPPEDMKKEIMRPPKRLKKPARH